MTLFVTLVVALLVAHSAVAEPKYHTKERDAFVEILNEGGRNLGYSRDSGVTILECDGYAFKDLNRNGRLDEIGDSLRRCVPKIWLHNSPLKILRG